MKRNMNKINKYTDIGVLILSLIIMGIFISWQIADELFMIDETLGLILFSVSVICKILDFKKVQYVVFILLLVLLLNVIKFGFTVVNGDVSTTQYSVSYTGLGFNLIIFFILILYLVVNRKVVFDLFFKLLYGSESEREERRNRDISFYYEKFHGCSAEEQNEAFKLYNDYPKEARIALDKINKEKGKSQY